MLDNITFKAPLRKFGNCRSLWWKCVVAQNPPEDYCKQNNGTIPSTLTSKGLCELDQNSVSKNILMTMN